MRFLLLALLVCGCGTVSSSPDGGGQGGAAETGGAGGGELGGAGAGGRSSGEGGAAGGVSSMGGAGGAIPECPKIGAVDITPSVGGAHCLVDCQGETDAGTVTVGLLPLCRISGADATSWSKTEPAYCVQYEGSTGALPSLCN